MENHSIELRPVRREDLWLFERQAVDPGAAGTFNWSGYRSTVTIVNQYEQNGLIGPDGGRLLVVSDDAVAGNVVWTKTTYGMPEWWCWNIGIALLPDFRYRGIGRRAQHLLVKYLFDTTAVARIEAYTDVENKAERRALENVGFTNEGTLRSAQFRNGRWCDLVLYSVLRHEFEITAAKDGM